MATREEEVLVTVKVEDVRVEIRRWWIPQWRL